MTKPTSITPMTPLRQAIAARMVEAKQQIPHFRMAAEIEVDNLLALRQAFNKDHPNTKISLNDLLIKACAMALIKVPALNIQLIDNQIHQFDQADIAVVVAVPGGLSTPIIKAADQKTVQAIAQDMQALAKRAKTGGLKLSEVSGGSFTISNLGAYDVDQFDAIINPPQCAILAVGSAKQKAIVKDQQIAIASVIKVNLSLDHRAIDGATAAEFIAALKQQIQHPETLLEDSPQ